MSCYNQQVLTAKRLFATLTLSSIVLLLTTAQASQGVEVRLASLLDDTRGFCIDILGSKSRAQVTSGLQAHTCYSYQGEIGIDQAFDKKRISENAFYLPGFDVCMTATVISSGAGLALQECNKQDSQQFDLQADGTIRLTTDASLCLTVSAKESIQGGGGTPPHLKRPLSLQTCDNSLSEFQTWLLYLP